MIDRRNFLQMTTASTLTSMLMLNGCWNPFADSQNRKEMPNFQENGVLRVAFSDQPKTFDPANASNLSEYSLGDLVYNGLVWLSQDLAPQPDLAESWEYTNDLLNWTFKLRQNVQFHHDSVLTATDVVYTFERILDYKTGSPLRSTLNFIENIKTLDDYTVRFTLVAPHSDFLSLLGTPQAKIVSKEYKPEFLAQKPSGTGRYRFDIYIQGELLALNRNPNYWDTAHSHSIEKLELYYISSQRQQVLALVNDKVDIIPEISSSQAENLADYPDIIIERVTSGAYNTIVMRATDPPFDNPLVRKALKHCLDRQVLLDTLLQGNGEVGNDHPIPSFNPYWNKLPQNSYDTDLARKLLTEAGYPDGLTLDLITSEVSPGMVQLAQMFSQMAAPAGVNIIVTPVSSDIYWTDYWNKHPPFFMSSWVFRPSTSATFMVAYHSKSQWNESRWHTPELDELLNLAQVESDQDRRMELYHEAQRILHDDGAVIIPYFRPILAAIHSRVHGFKPYPTGWIDIDNLQIVVEEN